MMKIKMTKNKKLWITATSLSIVLGIIFVLFLFYIDRNKEKIQIVITEDVKAIKHRIIDVSDNLLKSLYKDDMTLFQLKAKIRDMEKKGELEELKE